jgi:hypothetical protein
MEKLSVSLAGARWVLISALLALGTTTANAQSVSLDVVELQNGGRLRGTVMEYEPGVRVVIQMADGTTRTIAGAEVASVAFARPAEVVVAPPVIPEPTPPTPEAPPAQAAEPAAERWTTPRDFRAPRSEWTNDSLILTRRVPPGDFHFGVQLEGGLMVPMKDPLRNAGVEGVIGVYGFVEVATGRFSTLRIGPSLSYAGGQDFGTTSSYSAGSGIAAGRSLGVGGRLLFGSDLGDAFLRGGFEILAIPDVDNLPFEGSARFEFGARFLPSRTLEVGLAVAGGVSPVTSFYVDFATGDPRRGYSGLGMLLPRVDLFVGWVFE